MSETECHVGKLIKVEHGTYEDCEDVMRRLLLDEGVDTDSTCELEEHFFDKFYRKYVVLDKVVYKVEAEKFDDDADIMNASYDSDGNIDFQVKFYNGGCCFDEAVEEAFERMNTRTQETK